MGGDLAVGEAAILARAGGPLGFGTGELYAGRDRAQSLRLLAAAYDAGVRYFDTARLYGHGEAEGMVGEALRGKRDQVMLATKVGILPTDMSLKRRIADKAAHTLRKAPLLKALVAEPKPAAPTFGVFAPEQVRASVETSLTALGTDRVDLLLLHECTLENASDPALGELLAALEREGKILAWGVATDVETTAQIASTGPAGVRMLQFASDAWSRAADRIRPLAGGPVILHSVFAKRFGTLVQALKGDEALRAHARTLGVDPDDPGGLARRMLALQIHANPGGLVLFSSKNERNIAANMTAPTLSREEAEAAAALARLLA